MHANMHIFKPATTHWHLWNCHFHWGHSTLQPLPPESSWHFHNKRQKAWKESERAFDCQLKTQSWRVDKQFMSLLCEFLFIIMLQWRIFKISVNVCYSLWLARQANEMLIKLTDARYIFQLQLQLVFVVTSMCLYTSSVYINQSWRQEL